MWNLGEITHTHTHTHFSIHLKSYFGTLSNGRFGPKMTRMTSHIIVRRQNGLKYGDSNVAKRGLVIFLTPTDYRLLSKRSLAFVRAFVC